MNKVWNEWEPALLPVLLFALFWAATHAWTLVVLWAESRATRACVVDRAPVPPGPLEK